MTRLGVVIEEHATKPADDEWMRGFACALATLSRVYKDHSAVRQVMRACNVSVEGMRKAGVEGDDLDAICRSMEG